MNHRKVVWLLLNITFLSSYWGTCAPTAVAQLRNQSLKGQLHGLVSDLVIAAKADRLLEGERFQVGEINSRIPKVNHKVAMQEALKSVLIAQDVFDEDADFFINGEYEFTPEQDGVTFIQVTLQIVNGRGSVVRHTRGNINDFTQREVADLKATGLNDQSEITSTRTVNNGDDIAAIVKATVELPDAPSNEQGFRERNEVLFDLIDHPGFDVLRNGTEITTQGSGEKPTYTVEILRRRGDSPVIPLRPENKNGKGLAFVDLKLTDTFEIVVRNYDPSCSALAKISIDGLDVINTFSEDRPYAGYLIPKASGGGNAGKHVVPGWMRTTKSKKQNVWRFVINKFGEGAATEKKSTNDLGIISVQFFQAAQKGEQLRARSFGEVGRGELTDVNYNVQSLKCNDTAECTICVRYSIPPGL